MKLNLGCGRNILEGWVNVDSVGNKGVDIVTDLNLPESLQTYNIDPNSVDEMLLSHVIEHIREPLVLMYELYKVAKPGCLITIRCPHGASDDAAEDPTHVRFMYPGSFGYFGQPYYWRADYGYRGDWEIKELHLWVPKWMEGDLPEDIRARIDRGRNVVREIVCVLEAVKPTREPRRELQVYHAPIIHIADY